PRHRNQRGVMQPGLNLRSVYSPGSHFQMRFCRLSKNGILQHGKKMVKVRESNRFDDIARLQKAGLPASHMQSTGFALEKKIFPGPLQCDHTLDVNALPRREVP